jgi:IS5 family transposase
MAGLTVAHRSIGKECLGFASETRSASSLDGLFEMLDWTEIADLLGGIHANAKGEAAWPPLAMFKALLLAVWYDLSGVKLAEALDDRASFRRFFGFSGTEATPERTAFVRFRKALIAQGLDRLLFEKVTAQLKAKAITVKTGTLVDATIIASASEEDGDGRWVKHKGKPAVHGFKAHVGADADTAIVEEIAVTPANINDGRAGLGALPENPGEVFADSAYRGSHFRDAVRARGGVPRIVATACGGVTKPKRCKSSKIGTSRSTGCGAGSRRSSAPGNEATACAGCDGAASPKPPAKSISPPSPTTLNEPSISCSKRDEVQAIGEAMPHSHDPPIGTPQLDKNGEKLRTRPIRAQAS